MQDRIDHLESLVLSLMRRQQQPTSIPDEFSPQSDTALGTPSDRRDHVGTEVDAVVDADVDDDFQVEVESLTTPKQGKQRPCDNHDRRQVSPSPSDYGTIRMRKSGPSYANNTHWLAILGSITELREHVALESPSPEPVLQQHAPLTGFDLDTRPFPRPRLLYGCRVQASLSSILQAVPPRPVVDRLVSRYFNDLDMATGKHSVRNPVPNAKVTEVWLTRDHRRHCSSRQVCTRGTALSRISLAIFMAAMNHSMKTSGRTLRGPQSTSCGLVSSSPSCVCLASSNN